LHLSAAPGRDLQRHLGGGMQPHISYTAVLAAILATLIMDLGNLLGMRAGVAPPPPRPNGPDALGRWVIYTTRGRFTHRDIRETPRLRGEVAVGIASHHAIGTILTLAYLLILQMARLAPSTLTGLGYGLLTTIFPWFLMFPALGAGWLGSRVPRLTRTAIWNHTWYGIGLVVATAALHVV
jgi:Protein of unknown function (DUF2938)